MDDIIVLPKNLNISVVNQLLEQVRAELSNNNKIVLDAENVEEVDALGMQLVLAIEKTAHINKAEFQLINAKEELRSVLSSSMME